MSILPLLVPKPEIPGAIAAHGVGYNLGRTVGPALGGLLIIKFGLVAPFWIFVAANLGVIAALTWWRAPGRSISYYNKGELLGFMLDLAVRDASALVFAADMYGIQLDQLARLTGGDGRSSRKGRPPRSPRLRS